MLVIRYAIDGLDEALIGVRLDDGTVRRIRADTLAEALGGSFRSLVEQAASDGPVEDRAVRLLPPVDGDTEVWAAGVTYRRSSEARQEESEVADVYARVYDAERPELFFKSVAWRVTGPDEPVGVRKDSAVDVPEPEVAVVIAADGTIAGYTLCDDVSSRTIEGENPLYLPQAKVYAGSCALGPGIRPAWEIPDPYALTITASIARGDDTVWSASTSTSLLNRRFDELAAYLRRQLSFPYGVILSTGTGIVPGLDLTLRAGDTVSVSVPEIGVLRNPVLDAEPFSFSWLASGPARRWG